MPAERESGKKPFFSGKACIHVESLRKMIISKTDVFLFKKMGMMLLASGRNKSYLHAGIQQLNEYLNYARSDQSDPNYVRLEQTPQLINVINNVFDNTFIGCDTAWDDVSAQVKFSIIISTFWNRCFNSLWKLRIAAFNENAPGHSGITRNSLPIGVREYEYPALGALAKSLINFCNYAMSRELGQEDLRQSDVEDQRKRLTDMTKILKFQEWAIKSLIKAVTKNTDESCLQSLAELGELPQDLDYLRNALYNLMNTKWKNHIIQQQLGKEVEKLQSQLTEKSHALQKCQVSYNQLSHAYKESRAQVNQCKQNDDAIRRLHEALLINGGEGILEALVGLTDFPPDVDKVRSAVCRLLNAHRELSEEKKNLQMRQTETSNVLKQYQLAYDRLEQAFKESAAQVKQCKQKDDAIRRLHEALLINGGEGILEALVGLTDFPSDVDKVRSAVCRLLNAYRELSEEKKNLQLRLTETSNASKDNQVLYNQLMQLHTECRARVNQYQQKDNAIERLNEALLINGREGVLEALFGLTDLPSDVDKVRTAVYRLLNAQELSEENKNLQLRLMDTSHASQQYQPSQSTAPEPGHTMPSYYQSTPAYEEIGAQVNPQSSQYQQIDNAAEGLNEALLINGGEGVSEAPVGAVDWPSDVEIDEEQTSSMDEDEEAAEQPLAIEYPQNQQL